MKTKDLFRMEYAQILIYIVFLGLLEVLLFIFEVNYFLMIYLLLIGLILEGVYLCQRYMKKYRYYKKVKAKLDILEQKCMITEMLELPDFAEGEFLYEILQTCNKSMNDEILKYKIEAAGRGKETKERREKRILPEKYPPKYTKEKATAEAGAAHSGNLRSNYFWHDVMPGTEDQKRND